MRSYFFYLPLTFCAVFFAHIVSAQQLDSMMNVYADRLAPEKIHIHFDKAVYNKGETVWYKVYILQRGDSAAGSMNVYLEWYNAAGNLITQTVAPVLLSTSAGSFEIPADYNGAALHVRAFTRWMLNDDPAFIYQRELAVNTNSAAKAGPIPNKSIVATFPEGGFLIQGLRTRVAFKAVNEYGNPVFIKGVLADEKNNILDSLTVQHDGMGSFYLEPLPGQTYQLNWIDESGTTGSTPIPVTKKEGAQISVTGKKDRAMFQVDRTDDVAENFKRMTLLVHMNGIGLYQVAINTTEKKRINSTIPLNGLPSGLLQFTLFTSDWIPVAERIIFINNHSHEFDVKLAVPLANVEKKGKNIIEVFVADTLFTNMSVAVTDATVSTPDQHSIFSDILLSSEIKGKVYNSGYYFSGNGDSIAADLDLVMLTNGWRRFDWDKIRAGIPPKIDHPLESGYMKLNGKITGLKNNGQPMELNMVIVGKDSSRQFLSVPVAKNGSFEYATVFFDTAKVFFSLNNNKYLDKNEIQIDNGLLQRSPQNIHTKNETSYVRNDGAAKQKLDALLAQHELLRKKLAETTLDEVTVKTKVKTKEEKLDEKYTSGFFRESPAKKAYIIDMSDPNTPTSAHDIIEYLQGKVPGLVTDGGTLRWRGDATEVYLNEMRTDFATIKNIPLINIAMVKAFPPIFMFATGGGRGGAVIVYTRSGDDNKPQETKELPNLVLTGYTRFKEFYHPSYEQAGVESTKTDNRTTLYWNPNVITNKTQQLVRLEFFNNDFTKTFKIVLEGVNAAGKMARLEQKINANGKID
jgi:hypothetical protein